MPTFRRDDFVPIAQEMCNSLKRRHKTHAHVAFVFGPRQVLLAMSINRVGSRSLGAGFSDCMIHAERAALKAVGDIRKLKGSTLVVIQVGPQGNIKESYPCYQCRQHLEKCMRCYGLRRVFYS